MLDDTIDELRSVALGAADGSGYFPAMYARVTDRIRMAASGGRFGDSEGMAQFALAFARRYLDPKSGATSVPRCWQATWDVAGDRRLLIVQHLFGGINAHVNHDLPQVVVGLAAERGDVAGMRKDFDAVNDVLAETMPEVLGDLGRASRWVNAVASRGGTKAFKFSLTAARAQAWRAAVRLEGLDDDAQSSYVDELDRLVSVLAYLVAHPGPPASWLVRIGRILEEDDPVVVTKGLLGHLA